MPSKFSNSIALAALSIIGEKSNAMRLEHDAPGPELGVCECIENGETAYDGEYIAVLEGLPYKYPASYGSSVCAAHDAGLEPYCADEMPDFCGGLWCYVANDCAASDTTPSNITPGISYSFATCGDSGDFPDADEIAAAAAAAAAAEGEDAAAADGEDAAAVEGEDAAAVEGEEAAAAEGEEAAADTADAEDAAAAEGEDAAESTEGGSGCKAGQQAVTQKDHKGNNVSICINFMVNVTQAPAAAAAAADDCDEAEVEAVEEATTTDPDAATADADPLSGVVIDDEPVDDGSGAEVTVVEDPIVEDPVVEDPVVVVEDPVVEEPVVEEPVVEEPVVEVDPVPQPSVPSFLCCGPSQNDFNTALLDEHNARRALHMNTADLCYSSGLEFTAQNWVDELALADGGLNASDEVQRGGPWGENLFSDADPASNPGGALVGWYDEQVGSYDFAMPGDGTTELEQVLWKGTTCLGCAYAGTFVVCHYTAGADSDFVADNVFPLQ